MWSPINIFLSPHIWQCHRTWMMTVRELKLGKVSEQWTGAPGNVFRDVCDAIIAENDQFRQSRHSAPFGTASGIWYLHIWVRIWVPAIITPFASKNGTYRNVLNAHSEITPLPTIREHHYASTLPTFNRSSNPWMRSLAVTKEGYLWYFPVLDSLILVNGLGLVFFCQIRF